MKEHRGKRLCITGIPTAGKSTLTKKLAAETNGIPVLLDDVRNKLVNDEHYGKWVMFYLNQDEETYYTTVSPEQQWNNLVLQSEAFWPAFREIIDSYAEIQKPVIFESVNLLPHLIKELGFPGIALIGSTYEQTLERNKIDPRWGEGDRLLELNSHSFFFIERPRYKEEAEKCGFPIFEDAQAAYPTALTYLQ